MLRGLPAPLLNPEILEDPGVLVCLVYRRESTMSRLIPKMGFDPLARAKSLKDLNKLPKTQEILSPKKSKTDSLINK